MGSPRDRRVRLNGLGAFACSQHAASRSAHKQIACESDERDFRSMVESVSGEVIDGVIGSEDAIRVEGVATTPPPLLGDTPPPVILESRKF